jgi:DNA mismatch repair protein MSH5
VSAFGALIFYMLKSKAMLPGASDTVIVNDIVGLRNTSFMRVDIDTIEGLSIFAKELHPNLIQNKGRAKDGLSLFTLLDRTKSSLGRQRLREWLYRPLADISSIQNRQKGVEIMSKVECRDLQSSISSDMAKVGDVPRTILRIKKACATSLDWGRFIQSLQAMMRILNSIGVYAAEPATSQSDRLWLEDIVRNVDAHSISEVTLWLDAVISCDDAPTGEDRLSINLGYSETLDKAKALYRDLEYYLHEAGVKILSQHPFLERAAVEYIPHLGYLVAVDDTNINWEGTPFTHRYSDKGQQYLKHPVVEALDRDLGDIRAEITTETENIMRDVEDEVLRFEMPLQVAADTMASLDVIMSFGKVSTERQFVQPEVVEEPLLAIQGGRHPLHELTMDGFIPNDVYVNSEGKNACLVMGPNSSGKSTYLKMVGCIILLTHIGSHVPASKARIGITDMLLTRVSSSMPQSCVEPRSEFTADLNQICSLCRKFTQRSVCIIDDFGKSTAPVDGIALLATLVETVARSRARSIFTLPFPDVMDTNIINPDVMRFITMCTMQTIERGGGGGYYRKS